MAIQWRNLLKAFLLLGFINTFTACKDGAKEDSSSQGPKDPACSSKTAAQCPKSADCMASGTECIVSSTFCKKFAAKNECSKMSCTWDETSESCDAPSSSGTGGTGGSGSGSDSTATCESITSSAECGTNFSCEWNAGLNRCLSKSTTDSSSSSTSCGQIFNQTSCAAKTGCQWNGTTCVASTTYSSCGSYTQTQCVAPLCSWTGTQCIEANTNGTGTNASCTGKELLMCLFAKGCTWKFPMGPCQAK